MGERERTPQQNQNKQDILATNVDIKPSGVIYNIKGDAVEAFVENYLTSKGIDGIANVKVGIKNESRTPSVFAYLFIDKNSKGIISNNQNIPPMLRGKVDKADVKLSENLKQLLVPLAGQEFKAGKADRGEYYVKLNIFYILGLMFNAMPGRHQLTIPSAVSVPGTNDCVISVIKQEVYQKASGNRDNYSRQIEYLEKRCR